MGQSNRQMIRRKRRERQEQYRDVDHVHEYVTFRADRPPECRLCGNEDTNRHLQP